MTEQRSKHQRAWDITLQALSRPWPLHHGEGGAYRQINMVLHVLLRSPTEPDLAAEQIVKRMLENGLLELRIPTADGERYIVKAG